ncbi:hypothetical protein LINGRAHAP2_LOCUS30104 [Linum grandiflorum]
MMVALLRLLRLTWGAALLLKLKYDRLTMGFKLLGLWVSDGYRSILTRVMLLLSLLMTMRWIINMRLSLFNSRNSAAVNGKSRSPTFTVKLIMIRAIWLILAILSPMRCICLIHQIGTYSTGYIMT